MSESHQEPSEQAPGEDSGSPAQPRDPPQAEATQESARSRHPPGPRRPYREVTFSAMVVAILIGVVMNASITYAGLKIGFTIVGSAIAAVVGFGILRGLLRVVSRESGSIVEVNIAQTVASAVNTSNSGVIFTVPVLFLLGMTLDWTGTDFWLITLACIAGGVLGTAFIIPLRKQMIEIDRLRFPSAVGVATILKSPGGGVAKTVVLLGGMLLAAALYAPTMLPTLPAGIVGAGEIRGQTQRSVRELIAARGAEQGPDPPVDAGPGGAPPTLDALDELVLRGRLAPARAQAVRDLHGWIESEAAPSGLVSRGGLLAERRAAGADLAEEKEALCREPIPAGTRERIAALKARIAEIDRELEAPERAAFAGVPDELAIAAHAITRGEAPAAGSKPLTWPDLRAVKYGWAAAPLWGYQDLQLRLPDFGDKTSGEIGKLDPRVDRDGDYQPDLVVTDDRVDVGRAIGLRDEIQLVFAIAPFALGAGFITGRAGLMVLAGGVLAYFVVHPIAYASGWLPATVKAADAPREAWLAFDRPLGIGLLLGGALMGVVASFPAILAALKSIAGAGRTAGRGGRDELGLGPLLVAVAIAGGLLFFAADFIGSEPLNKGGLDPVSGLEVACSVEPAEYKGYAIAFADEGSRRAWESGGTYGDGAGAVTWNDAAKDAYLRANNAKPGLLSGLNPHARAAVIALVGILWIWFAGIIIAQCTGMTDWSPISGVALLTVVLVLLLAGTGAVMGAVLIGAALCVAVTLASDMMSDLKTGHMVGAKPIRQQITELAVVPIGPVVTMLTILIIVGANLKTTGIPIGPGTTTGAPQAQALEAIVRGVQGGDMPYALYGLGAALGVLLGLGSFSGLGVLVGLSMYLPFMYIATYGIGCIANILLRAFKGPRWTEEWGVPFAAGLIVGESILALVFNVFILAAG